MPGLSLRANLGAASAGGPVAGYATSENLHPAPAAMPTGPRRSTWPAWGYAEGRGAGSAAHAMAVVTGGILGAALLLALWWSLPR
ncbi:MAG: hypothetical protein J2P28_21760 [Actinobacteria bacterium]|nr:hypothetical protein [Actinomycetota bacterium]